MREAIIRVDGHATTRFLHHRAIAEPMYVSRVGVAGPNGLRDFDLTKIKRNARAFTLQTAARIVREIGPTEYQFSVCDAQGVTA